jgi:hypothetical protein
MHSLTTSLVKSCDGTYLQYNRNESVTMYLARNEQGIFSISFINEQNSLLFSETLTKRKNPLFGDKIFSVLGQAIFETEKDSISRYNDMRKFFEQYFNTKYDYLLFNGNNYEGETKDDVPNGQGILYYGQTSGVMVKSTFVNGFLDGATVLYSQDQNIELVCDDICNMKPVQFGTVIFKNQNLEKDVDFSDFNSQYPDILKKKDIDTFVRTVAKFTLLNDKNIKNIDLFLFSNKTQQEQYSELFEMLVQMRKEQQLQSQQLVVSQKYFQYTIIGMALGFVFMLFNLFF